MLFSKQRNSLRSLAFFCMRMLRSLRSLTFFAKECWVLCILLCSLQKNVAFFYILKKEPKRTHCSFGSHKLPKTLKKKVKKNVAFFKRMQKNNAFRTEKNAVPNPVTESQWKWRHLPFPPHNSFSRLHWWVGVKIIYRWHFKYIWLSLYEYSLKFVIDMPTTNI